ncbi:unnamed protein product [Lactuca saligna]|uniref:EF-hand domain-containing protein n=2 Tax=Lactuca TaxID=4235 RepID=A0AA35YIY3_LACSI|nr:unnamed protein product [Lactuca saligna]
MMAQKQAEMAQEQAPIAQEHETMAKKMIKLEVSGKELSDQRSKVKHLFRQEMRGVMQPPVKGNDGGGRKGCVEHGTGDPHSPEPETTMSLLFSHNPSLLFENSATTTTATSSMLHYSPPISLSFSIRQKRIKSAFTRFSSNNPPTTPEWNATDQTVNDDEESDGSQLPTVTDEWGEKSEPENEPPTRLSTSDPPQDEDEWGTGAIEQPEEEISIAGNGSQTLEVTAAEDNGKIEELKRCLVDSVYGTGLGFRASTEERAEIMELVTQLEAINPTPAPTEAVELLDGNWILLYTAFSELLPLLAVGTTPLLKVDKICQEISTTTLTIDNSITFSTPFATFTSTASANFEVRSPSRIQVQFKEGSFQPPKIKSNQSLNPLQEAVASLAGAISGQAPLKIPIPEVMVASLFLLKKEVLFWINYQIQGVIVAEIEAFMNESKEEPDTDSSHLSNRNRFVECLLGQFFLRIPISTFIICNLYRSVCHEILDCFSNTTEMSSDKEAVKLDDEQLGELREIFRSFDRNNDGSLTQLELGSLLRSLGLTPSPDQLDALIQKADTNSNGLVEFSEFVALVAPELLPAKSPYTDDQMKQLFKMFDRDGNGYITAAELAHSMAKLGHALTAEELTGMIKEADTDGDGRINFQEFSRAITSAAFDNSFS